MTERTKPADTTEENDESGKDGAQQIVDFGSALTKTPHEIGRASCRERV